MLWANCSKRDAEWDNCKNAKHSQWHDSVYAVIVDIADNYGEEN